ncbi:Polyprenol reductase [Erysiphe necator]|nr:Polyprenol reductase [Erysiphe necator]
MNLSLLCKIFFLSGSTVCFGGVLLSSFRHQIMEYGSRSTYKTARIGKQKQPLSLTTSFSSWIASFRVPHSWFTHYYIASLISSYFWLYQIITYGAALRFIKSISTIQSFTVSMSINQILLTWLLMTIQGSRRLLESLTLMRASNQSQMWVGIWIMGIIFYLVMGITVWIEGISRIDHDTPFGEFSSLYSEFTLKTSLALAIFILASIIQNICHRHLFSLQKYSLPNHRLFQWVTCPHYTCECFIYLSLALISAPYDRLFNSTVFMGFIFVVSNLAVTADGTKKWYDSKFGRDKVIAKWRMVPLLY